VVLEVQTWLSDLAGQGMAVQPMLMAEQAAKLFVQTAAQAFQESLLQHVQSSHMYDKAAAFH
jgi:hypothetical protein